jgi:hypothetical protein
VLCRVLLKGATEKKYVIHTSDRFLARKGPNSIELLTD